MLNSLLNNLELLKTGGNTALLTQLGHGLEKEGLRVDAQGVIAQTDHPRSLGSTLTHPQITTDYSEALLEFITPVSVDVEDALQHLADLHRFSFHHLGDEELWAASMPCRISSEDQIRIAEYGSSNIGQLKHIYRVGLQYRYGKMMQTIAGIHYNFSLPEEFWPQWQALKQSDLPVQDFASDCYFALIRNFRRYSWLLLYLFGASPALGRDFMLGAPHQLEQLDNETLYLPWATSLRMSDLGYSNRAQEGLNICFNELPSYAESLHLAINTPYKPYQTLGIQVNGQYRQLNANVLQIENEYYSDIRPKRVTFSGEKPVHALMERGVQYIEVRNTDINPLLPLGIDLTQSYFLDAFLLTCLFAGDQKLSDAECAMLNYNKAQIVKQGRMPGLMLQTLHGERDRESLGREILEQVQVTAELLDQLHNTQRYRAAVAEQEKRLADPQLTPSAIILNELRDSGLSYHQWTLMKSREHRRTLGAGQLDSNLLAQLTAQAEHSISEQAELEMHNREPFAAFLDHFMNG